MNAKRTAALAAFALAGIGLAGCSSLGLQSSSGTGATSAYSSASPQPLQNGPSSAAAGQSSASPAAAPRIPYGYASQEQAEQYESAFRQLDTNHDGVIDRSEFAKLKLMR